MGMNLTKRSSQHGASILGGAVPALMVFAASVLWGSGGLFVSALEGFGLTNPEMTVVRLATALLAMSVLLVMRHGGLTHVERADWPRFLLLGTVGSFAFVLLYNYAISITGMATAAVLLYLMPSLVTVGGYARKGASNLWSDCLIRTFTFGMFPCFWYVGWRSTA